MVDLSDGLAGVVGHCCSSAARIITDITSTTGIELIGHAPDFLVLCDTTGIA